MRTARDALYRNCKKPSPIEVTMPTTHSLLCLVHKQTSEKQQVHLCTAAAAAESLSGDLWCNGQREPCCSTWCLCFSIRSQPRTSRGEAFLPSFFDCLPPRKQKATMKRKQTPYMCGVHLNAGRVDALDTKNAVFLHFLPFWSLKSRCSACVLLKVKFKSR